MILKVSEVKELMINGFDCGEECVVYKMRNSALTSTLQFACEAVTRENCGMRLACFHQEKAHVYITYSTSSPSERKLIISLTNVTAFC